jgi:hypothetical protein
MMTSLPASAYPSTYPPAASLRNGIVPKFHKFIQTTLPSSLNPATALLNQGDSLHLRNHHHPHHVKPAKHYPHSK